VFVPFGKGSGEKHPLIGRGQGGDFFAAGVQANTGGGRKLEGLLNSPGSSLGNLGTHLKRSRGKKKIWGENRTDVFETKWEKGGPSWFGVFFLQNSPAEGGRGKLPGTRGGEGGAIKSHIPRNFWGLKQILVIETRGLWGGEGKKSRPG